jgi:hypothetical protein
MVWACMHAFQVQPSIGHASAQAQQAGTLAAPEAPPTASAPPPSAQQSTSHKHCCDAVQGKLQVELVHAAAQLAASCCHRPRAAALMHQVPAESHAVLMVPGFELAPSDQVPVIPGITLPGIVPSAYFALDAVDCHITQLALAQQAHMKPTVARALRGQA